MVTFVPDFVSSACAAWTRDLEAAGVEAGLDPDVEDGWEEIQASYSAQHPEPVATLDDVVAHVEHVREVAGVDHVGLGGDYDGTPTLPAGLEDVTGYPRLLAALADRGWSGDDLARLTCRNVLRVMRDAEAVAASLSTTVGPSLSTIEELDGADPAT